MQQKRPRGKGRKESTQGEKKNCGRRVVSFFLLVLPVGGNKRSRSALSLPPGAPAGAPGARAEAPGAGPGPGADPAEGARRDP